MKFRLSIMVVLAICLMQFGTLSVSQASEESADINIHGISRGYAGTTYRIWLCNYGATVTSMTFEVEQSNFELNFVGVAMPDENVDATDTGTFDLETLTWEGIIEDTQCTEFVFSGTETGEVGEFAEFSVSIISSTLEGGIENVDPNLENNTATLGPVEITLPPDAAITTRLLTQGEITADTPLSYEVVVSNVGLGTHATGTIVLSFIVPSVASFEDVVDGNEDDAVDIVMCMELGPPSTVGPGLAGYDGTIVFCLLDVKELLEPGFSTSFIFNMTATDEFANGEVSVYAVLTADDVDSIQIQRDIVEGRDPYLMGTNNIVLLPYNNQELTVTVNRCPGQGFISTTGSGCFRVSFNKLIWEPSFTADKIVLNGGGTIDSITRVNDYSWDVVVKDIPHMTTISLTLVEGGIIDFSAVANGTHVLGENMIRFEVAGETSGNGQAPGDSESDTTGTLAGSLPMTGTSASVLWLYAIVILFAGLTLKTVSARTSKI